MIRFVLKSAFFLGLAAMILPGITGNSATSAADGTASVDLFSTVAGAQAAIADLSGFCDRAPSACLAGGELARFAAERIGDGIALASGYVGTTVSGSGTEPRLVASTPAPETVATPRDRIVTGAVERRGSPLSAAPHKIVPAGFSMPSLGTAPRHRDAALPPESLPAFRPPLPSPAPRA